MGQWAPLEAMSLTTAAAAEAEARTSIGVSGIADVATNVLM